MAVSKKQDLPPAEHLQIGAVFTALSDPCRRLIIRELLGEPDNTPRKCSSFGVKVSKSTMTHHFRVLREAGLVIQYNHGNCSELTLRKADLESRFPGLLALLASNDDQPKKAPSRVKTSR